MRKIKSTALLGAFVAVASVGVISHEAHGATVTSIVNTIAKESLASSSIVTLPAPLVTPGANYPSGATVTLTLSGANFVSSDTYAILNSSGAISCSTISSSLAPSSITLGSGSGCSLSANGSYTIVTVTNSSTLQDNTSFIVDSSQNTSSIVLSYSTNINDTPSSVTLAKVVQQLTVTPASATTATIDPSSLSTFVIGSSTTNTANNTMTISSSTGFADAIGSDILNVVFNGIPSSVSTISTSFTYTYNSTADTSSSNYTQGTGSATVSLTLPQNDAVFSTAAGSPNSNTATFNFINSGNIQPGTISISTITGNNNYQYFSGSQNFLSFAIGGTQIYIPDASASISGNAIQASYITISMPSTASIASISVLNNQTASCPAPSLANGLLQSTSTTGVYYIDLSQLAQSCTGISSVAWQSGVPLVININGTNATPTQITADAYAVIKGFGLKRIPVNVLNASSSSANFSY